MYLLQIVLSYFTVYVLCTNFGWLNCSKTSADVLDFSWKVLNNFIEHAYF